MATYQFVPEHNGIEIYFDVKPSDEVLEELRGNGWRWHRVKECWFTKKSAEAEALAQKLCKQNKVPVTASEAGQVNIQQSSGSVFVSTLTIYKNSQGYSWSSTNNQVICCDCNRFFSIHANACPFCGCPTGYIAEHYYSKFDPEVIRQQQIEEERRKQAELRRIKQEEEKAEKESLIDRIATCWYGEMAKYFSYKFHGKFYKTSLSALRVAAERADSLGAPKHPLCISEDSYVEILKGSTTNYQKVLRCLTKINNKKNELPAIGDKEWNNLLSLNSSDFDVRIGELMESHRLRQEAAAKEAKRRQAEEAIRKEKAYETMLGRYNLSGAKLSSLLERYGSKEALYNRLQAIDNIAGDYRHKIDAIKYIDALDALKQLVKTLK